MLYFRIDIYFDLAIPIASRSLSLNCVDCLQWQLLCE